MEHQTVMIQLMFLGNIQLPLSSIFFCK